VEKAVRIFPVDVSVRTAIHLMSLKKKRSGVLDEFT